MIFQTAKSAQEWIDSQEKPDRYRIDCYANGNKTEYCVVDMCRFG